MQNHPLTKNKQKQNKYTKGTETNRKHKNSQILLWNKGNSDIHSKLDEIEYIIDKQDPKIFIIVEANISPECHIPSIEIDNFTLERDNLHKQNIRSRTAIYISNQVSYRRREDLEIEGVPIIWLEIKEGTTKSWLLMAGYRQWTTLTSKT